MPGSMVPSIEDRSRHARASARASTNASTAGVVAHMLTVPPRKEFADGAHARREWAASPAWRRQRTLPLRSWRPAARRRTSSSAAMSSTSEKSRRRSRIWMPLSARSAPPPSPHPRRTGWRASPRPPVTTNPRSPPTGARQVVLRAFARGKRNAERSGCAGASCRAPPRGRGGPGARARGAGPAPPGSRSPPPASPAGCQPLGARAR